MGSSLLLLGISIWLKYLELGAFKKRNRYLITFYLSLPEVFTFYNNVLLLVDSVHVKHKIFLSAIEYLPFSPGDTSKASFEEIIDRYFFQLSILTYH